jgi:hypothetical protein
MAGFRPPNLTGLWVTRQQLSGHPKVRRLADFCVLDHQPMALQGNALCYVHPLAPYPTRLDWVVVDPLVVRRRSRSSPTPIAQRRIRRGEAYVNEDRRELAEGFGVKA